jgi:hypothetical protein
MARKAAPDYRSKREDNMRWYYLNRASEEHYYRLHFQMPFETTAKEAAHQGLPVTYLKCKQRLS